MGTLKAHHCLPVSSKKSKNLKNSQKSLHAAATTQRQLRVTAFTVFNQQWFRIKNWSHKQTFVHNLSET